MRCIDKGLRRSAYCNRDRGNACLARGQSATTRDNGKGAGIKVSRLRLRQDRRPVGRNGETSPQVELSVASFEINRNAVDGQRSAARVVEAKGARSDRRAAADKYCVRRALPGRREISAGAGAIGEAGKYFKPAGLNWAHERSGHHRSGSYASTTL